MAQKRTKKASPKRAAKKTTKRRPTKTKSRRSWTAEQKAEMVAYADANGMEATVKKFKIPESSIYRWRRTVKPVAKAAKRTTKRRKRRSKATNGVADMVSRLSLDNIALKKEVSRLQERERKLESALAQSIIERNG